MFVLFFLGLLSLLLTYPGTSKNPQRGLKFAFLMIAVVTSIRYRYGNDYIDYYSVFQAVVSENSSFEDSYYSYSEIFDPGWSVFCFLFKPVGFYWMVAFLSFFKAFAAYIFIKDNVPPRFYYVSMLFYMFTPMIFPIQLSMMRQGFIIDVFMLCFVLIKRKKPFVPLLVLLLLTTVHKATFIIVPFVFWYFIPKRVLKYVSVGILVLFVIFLISKNTLSSVFNYFFTFEGIEMYQKYETNIESEFGIRNMIHVLPSIVTTFLLFKFQPLYLGDVKNNNIPGISSHSIEFPPYLLLLPSITILLMPFNQLMPMLVRLGFFFNQFIIVAYPYMFHFMEKSNRKALVSILLIVLLFENYLFYFGDIYSKYFMVYHTLFEL